MSEQRAQPGPQQQAPRPQGGQPQPGNAPRPPQGRPARADLSRDELRAHLANVESQIKSALRIIASESKGSQQAHSALRADLSSALVRLQADMNGSASDLNSKVDRLGAEISFLNRQRRVGRVIFLTFGMSLSFILGVLVIVSWLMIKEGAFQNVGIPVPIEEMFERNPQSAAPQSNTNTPVLDQRPAASPQSAPSAPVTQQSRGIGILPPPVQQQPLSAQQRLTPQQLQQPPPLQLAPGSTAPDAVDQPAVPAQSQAQPELPASIFKRSN
jgi:hypothetical protein